MSAETTSARGMNYSRTASAHGGASNLADRPRTTRLLGRDRQPANARSEPPTPSCAAATGEEPIEPRRARHQLTPVVRARLVAPWRASRHTPSEPPNWRHAQPMRRSGWTLVETRARRARKSRVPPPSHAASQTPASFTRSRYWYRNFLVWASTCRTHGARLGQRKAGPCAAEEPDERDPPTSGSGTPPLRLRLELLQPLS